MSDKMFENNQVSIVGEIVSDFRYSHEVYGEGFYMVDISVRRLSDFVDYIPVMVSERLINVNEDLILHLEGFDDYLKVKIFSCLVSAINFKINHK